MSASPLTSVIDSYQLINLISLLLYLQSWPNVIQQRTSINMNTHVYTELFTTVPLFLRNIPHVSDSKAGGVERGGGHGHIGTSGQPLAPPL